MDAKRAFIPGIFSNSIRPKPNSSQCPQILPWLWPPAGFAAGVDAAFAVVLVARVVLVAVVLVAVVLVALGAGPLAFGA